MGEALADPGDGMPEQVVCGRYVMEPQNARDGIHPVKVPPNPFGMVFNDTPPLMKVDGVPANQVMYRLPRAPVALMQTPTVVPAVSVRTSEPNGMLAAVIFPALVAVVDLNNIQPLAEVMEGVV